MLRERALGETLGSRFCRRRRASLPAELAKVDEILDQDRFLAPFRRRLTATTCRPTVAIDTYLRLMFLKHRYGLGYETLCKEVADSLTWRARLKVHAPQMSSRLRGRAVGEAEQAPTPVEN